MVLGRTELLPVEKYLELESNQRPLAYQTSALATELSRYAGVIRRVRTAANRITICRAADYTMITMRVECAIGVEPMKRNALQAPALAAWLRAHILK